MGRFSTIVVLLLAACGDNTGIDTTPNDDGTINPGDDGAVTPTPRYVPSVCGSETWTSNVSDKLMDVAVAGRPEGATVISVPQLGGSPTGFVLDTRMRMLAGETKVAIDMPFDQIAVSYIGGRIATTGLADGSAFLHLLDDNLGNPQFIVKVPANTVAKPAFYNTQSDIVMPAGTDAGLMLYRFQDSAEPVDSQLVLPTTKPITSLAAAQVGVATLAAASTGSECHLMLMPGYAAGRTIAMKAPCPNPGLAVNAAADDAMMVFDSPEGIRMMHTHVTQFDGTATLVRPDSSAPRVLFDGSHYWVSYLDVRGDVIVGIVEGNHLISMSLNGPKPWDTAYQLVMVEGAPWIFALDDTGYTGHRLCTTVEY